MTGRATIIDLLKWYFRTSGSRVARFSRICDVLLSGLIDGSSERTPAFYDMEAEINALALTFLPNNQYDLVTIQNDLWTILVNWWDTVRWARRDVRAFMEKEDLLADLIDNIVKNIKNDINTRRYYKRNVLQALIQMSAPPGYIITPYVGQPLPRNIDLNIILQCYEQLSHAYDFDNEVHILLQLLFDKMTRNTNRHAYYTVQEYRLHCCRSGTQPSFQDYISYRGLTISPELSVHCERLFQTRYRI
jgi:hypothetical protein